MRLMREVDAVFAEPLGTIVGVAWRFPRSWKQWLQPLVMVAALLLLFGPASSVRPILNVLSDGIDVCASAVAKSSCRR